MDDDEWEVIYTDSDRQMLQSRSEIKEIKSHIKSNRLLIKNLFLEISDIMKDKDIDLNKSRHFHDFFVLHGQKYIEDLCCYFGKQLETESLQQQFDQEVKSEIIRLENICLANNNNDYMTDIKEICLKFYILVKKLIDFDISEEQSNQIILLFFPLIISVIFE